MLSFPMGCTTSLKVAHLVLAACGTVGAPGNQKQRGIMCRCHKLYFFRHPLDQFSWSRAFIKVHCAACPAQPWHVGSGPGRAVPGIRSRAGRQAGPTRPAWWVFENQKLAKATFEQLAAYVFPLCIVSLAGPFFGLLKLQFFSWVASLGV